MFFIRDMATKGALDRGWKGVVLKYKIKRVTW